MRDIERFISGFRSFQKEYFGSRSTHYDDLQHGQSPKTMLIGCSDSRVDPAILTNCKPGDLFTVRNIANLVPPCEKDGGKHGVSAALEFAVCSLEVEDIIVLGHSGCSGIKALMSGQFDKHGEGFISQWMNIAAPAKEQILADLHNKDPQLQQRAAEQAAILLSIENLHSFPFIVDRIANGTLSLHGWYFDLGKGELLEYNTEQRAFDIHPDTIKL